MAPDSFRGTLSAPEAATALAAGWRRHAPDDEVVELPMSDGGPGFLDAVRAALPGELVPCTVGDPDGRDVPGAVLLVGPADDPAGVLTVYVDTSQAVGEHLDRGNASRAVASRTSRGAGQLLAAALALRPERLVVGVGRAGVLDGGAGAIAALLGEGTGDAPGDDVRAVADGGLVAAAAADGAALAGLRDLRDRLAGVHLVVATDTDAPLVGRHGPVRGAGPALGLRGDDLRSAEAAMTAWATVLVDALTAAGAADPGRLVALPGAGAGGGLGAALLALGAEREPGASVVAEVARLPEAVADADLVVTGEGAFDWDSLRGRVVGAVADVAGRHGVPVVVVAGQVLVGRRELAAVGVESAYPVAAEPRHVPAAMADPAGTLAARTERVARTWHR